MKHVEIWQSMDDDNGGIGQVPGQFFWSRDEAKKRCSGWGVPPMPVMHRAVVDEDETVYLLSSSVKVYNDITDLDKQIALSKLSAHDRKVLGV